MNTLNCEKLQINCGTCKNTLHVAERIQDCSVDYIKYRIEQTAENYGWQCMKNGNYTCKKCQKEYCISFVHSGLQYSTESFNTVNEALKFIVSKFETENKNFVKGSIKSPYDYRILKALLNSKENWNERVEDIFDFYNNSCHDTYKLQIKRKSE